jgi:DNA-directed RNA polymerase specialized sigma24 family protein
LRTPEDAAVVTDLIEKGLEGLDPSYADIFPLRLAGCTHIEIAQKLGWGPEAVKFKLTRIRERLRGLAIRDSEK